MITVRCPIRISLLGGGSDLDIYLNHHSKGSVISFTPDLYTYVSIYRDVLGRNNLNKKYIVNYSIREEVENINKIKNDLVRLALIENNSPPCSVHMTSDIFSHGSGLAVSSSYSCALTYALNEYNNINISEIECGNRAHILEKKINPLLGMQDIFGCCIGGFKKIEFTKNEKYPKYTFLPTDLFNHFDLYLYYTGITRSSTEVLKTVICPEEDILNPLVSEAENLIIKQQYYDFMKLIKLGWEEKKKMSKGAMINHSLVELDTWISSLHNCVASKLCGAGNGGFFLVFFEKGTEVPDGFKKISISKTGVRRLI
jgi:D-glycero-alpha-D-manno-heptose-7-phosphate kinase